MPIDPVADSTIEDENDADFELDDLFKEPNNRSMAVVTAHAQGLVFVDARIKEYFFSKAKELLKRDQWDE
jgi:tRNA U38,U39,U40 pseudouridine synthase TruA